MPSPAYDGDPHNSLVPAVSQYHNKSCTPLTSMDFAGTRHPLCNTLLTTFVVFTSWHTAYTLHNPLLPDVALIPQDWAGGNEVPGPLWDLPFTCPQPPAPLINVMGVYFYLDAAGTLFDPLLYIANNLAVAQLNDFADGLADLAALYWGSRPLRGEVAACALSWLQTWVQGRGEKGIIEGQYVVLDMLSNRVSFESLMPDLHRIDGQN